MQIFAYYPMFLLIQYKKKLESTDLKKKQKKWKNQILLSQKLAINGLWQTWNIKSLK